jgi:hypothetical protein
VVLDLPPAAVAHFVGEFGLFDGLRDAPVFVVAGPRARVLIFVENINFHGLEFFTTNIVIATRHRQTSLEVCSMTIIWLRPPATTPRTPAAPRRGGRWQGALHFSKSARGA